MKQGNAVWALTGDVAVRTGYIMRVLRENQERLKGNAAQLLLMRVTMIKREQVGLQWRRKLDRYYFCKNVIVEVQAVTLIVIKFIICLIFFTRIQDKIVGVTGV